jgi:hypothetical protein
VASIEEAQEAEGAEGEAPERAGAREHATHVHPGPDVGGEQKDKKKQRRDAKVAIAVGVVGAILAYLAYSRQKASATSAQAGTTPTVSTTTAPVAGDLAGYTGGGDDGYGQSILDALQGISTQIGGLSASAIGGSGNGAGTGEGSGSAPNNPYEGEALQGSGWGLPTGYGSGQSITSLSGQTFAGGLTPTSAASLQKAGTPLYYQSSPGVFTQNTGGLAAGTPLFQKV